MNAAIEQLSSTRARPTIRGLAASVVPPTLIALFYTLVAINWWNELLNSIRAVADNDKVAIHVLSGAHAASTGFFFSLLAVITITRKRPIRRERRLKGWLLPVIVIAAMGVTGIGEPRELPLPLAIFSTGLVIGGTAFTLYALRFLGRHFGVVSDVRGLVTSGPYSWVRHPLYAGEAITLTGVVIAVASPLTVAGFVIGLGLQTWRARTEEESLASAFPEYRAYAARTPMIVPGLRWGRHTGSAAAGD